MVKIETQQVGHIDIDAQVTKDGSWYTYANFTLSKIKKYWFIRRKIEYKLDSFLLLVCSGDIDPELIPDLTGEEFDKRLILKNFSSDEVHTYIESKVKAFYQSGSDDIFDFLSKYFVPEE